jgi:hypothetical protein
MGLLEQEIQELRQMNKRIIAGTIKPDEVHQRIAVYSQIEKRSKMMLQAFALQAKHGKRQSSGLTTSNLIGDGSMIDIGADQENEQISCPDLEKMISRHECLDYSGDTKNVESCKSCDHFNITRRVLIGDK